MRLTILCKNFIETNKNNKTSFNSNRSHAKEHNFMYKCLIGYFESRYFRPFHRKYLILIKKLFPAEKVSILKETPV